jgi:hypothetical protein
MGRPIEWTKKRKADLLADFLAYIEESDIPIEAEFAYMHGMSKSYLYSFPEFSEPIKLCVTKKEANLQVKGLNREIDTTMAIFSLKQLGWKDKQEIEHSGSVTIIDDIPRK